MLKPARSRIPGSLLEARDERRADRSLRVEPLQLVLERMRLREDARRAPAEVDELRVALADDREPLDRNAVDARLAGLELVPPRQVVPGTGRQHVNIDMRGEVARRCSGRAAPRRR